MNRCHLRQEELIQLRGNQVKELGRLPTGATNPQEPYVKGQSGSLC